MEDDGKYYIILSAHGCGQNISVAGYAETADELKALFRQFMAGMGYWPDTIKDTLGEAP